jgi:adenine-specific DNA-methyltransferase
MPRVSAGKTRIELSWTGREAGPELPSTAPRMVEVPELGRVAARVGAGEGASEDEGEVEGVPGEALGAVLDNRLIHGDNSLALAALCSELEGQVRCVYVDPPFNTGVAFEHYHDGDDHGRWLQGMALRAQLFHRLLRRDGSLWVHLDDNEVHYMKVLLDGIFGRENFVASVVWQRVFAKKNKALISGSHDTILVYAKEIGRWRRNLVPREDAQLKAYRNPDDDPRGLWQSVSYSVRSEDAERRAIYRYPIARPAGGEVLPPAGRHWNGLPDRTAALIADDRLWFGPKGDRSPRIKVFLSEVQDGIVPDSWWTYQSCGTNQEAKRELLRLFPGVEPFTTPKPERLLERILRIASDPGELVLDAFAGSGTTGAVAHKLGRRWVMIERGEHCLSHVRARMLQVIDGADEGGITPAVGWRGGGGFRFFRVEPGVEGEA